MLFQDWHRMTTANNHPETWSSKPAGAEFWHPWTVIIPRRSIAGRLVRGRVWRRHDGRRWRYKEFVDNHQGRDGTGS
jgi:hypothetical protein